MVMWMQEGPHLEQHSVLRDGFSCLQRARHIIQTILLFRVPPTTCRLLQTISRHVGTMQLQPTCSSLIPTDIKVPERTNCSLPCLSSGTKQMNTTRKLYGTGSRLQQPWHSRMILTAA